MPLRNREGALINFLTDTSPSTFACSTLGISYYKYLRSSYAAVSKSPSGTQTRVQSEERSSEKQGYGLYLSNACVATIRVAVRASEYFYITRSSARGPAVAGAHVPGRGEGVEGLKYD